MSVIVSHTERLYFTPTAPVPSTGTAVGYDAADLTRGDVADSWMSSASGLTHDIDVRIDSGTPPTFAAIFAAVGKPTKRPYQITIYRSSGWPITSPFMQVPAMSLNGRGDAAAILGNLSGAIALRFRIQFAGTAQCSVGRIWIGEHSTLPRSYAQRTDAPEYSVIENVSEARSVFAHELADYVERFKLGFGRLTKAERDAARSVFDAVRGSRRSFVLVPDHTDLASVYHGRIGPSLPHQIDFPEHTGLTWDFTESGRALG